MTLTRESGYWRVLAEHEPPFDYEVRIVEGLFDPAADHGYFAPEEGAHGPRLVIVDSLLPRQHTDALRAYLEHHDVEHEIAQIDVSEQRKTLGVVETIVDVFGRVGVPHRGNPPIGVGGGVMCDVVGMAAHLYRRGIAYDLVPTSLIGQLDAAIGVKRGVNHRGVNKNRLGGYHPARRVLICPDLLATLPRRHVANGLAEALKLAIIRDEDLFADLERFGAVALETAMQGDGPVTRAACRRILASAIDGMLDELAPNLTELPALGPDGRESTRRWMDFGHGLSPLIELEPGAGLLHGESVMVDAAICTEIAAERGLLSVADRDRILAAMRLLEQPTWHLLQEELVVRALEDMALHRGAQNIPVPTGIGGGTFLTDVTAREVTRAVAVLSELHGPRS